MKNYTSLGESEKLHEGGDPSSTSSRIHWAEMKGDHPERKNNKKKSLKVEGSTQKACAVSCVCTVEIHRALNAKLRRF